MQNEGCQSNIPKVETPMEKVLVFTVMVQSWQALVSSLTPSEKDYLAFHRLAVVKARQFQIQPIKAVISLVRTIHLEV